MCRHVNDPMTGAAVSAETGVRGGDAEMGRGGGALTINQVQVFKFPSDSQVLSFSSKPAEIAVVIDVSIASIAAGSFFC